MDTVLYLPIFKPSHFDSVSEKSTTGFIILSYIFIAGYMMPLNAGFQPFCILGYLQSRNERINIPVNNIGKVVKCEPDTVIGDTALRKIVRANFCRAVTG